MKTVRVIIELEIEEDTGGDALETVDRILDGGHLQDEINDNGHLYVKSAVCRGEEKE